MKKGSSKFEGKTVKLCIFLSDQFKAEVQTYATAHGTTLSGFVRDALKMYIRDKNRMDEDATTGREIQSFHEVDESHLD